MSDDQKTALEIAREKLELVAKVENDKRTDLTNPEKPIYKIGTRVRVGATRGKNPQAISFEQFEESLPDTLPKTLQSFLEVTKATEAVMLDYAIRGYNEAQYEAASDPLAEFVAGKWAQEVQSTFRQAVRNYSRGLGISLEDAVSIIRPGFVAKFGE